MHPFPDRFYPDFVCWLNDGLYPVVEYNGEDRRSNEDSQEKRIIVQVWEKRSQDQGLFLIPAGWDWGGVREKI